MPRRPSATEFEPGARNPAQSVLICLRWKAAMPQSSVSVGALAAALAKAQIELINPEKSLIASIAADRRGEPKRTFRYAPLASGLEIVRKTLGKYELAVMQTTAVDQPGGTVNLTTVLAHSSGEWMSS